MRIGLIGAGAVAELHAQAALRHPDAVVSAVCDVAEDAARRVGHATDAAVFTDYRALLDAGVADAVIVNTPHAFHAEMACYAAAAGVHVLMEKPMATTLADCDRMMEACSAAGVLLAVGHVQHFLPDKVAVRRELDEGNLGRPVLLHDYRSTNYSPGSRSAWFFQPELAGGGALMNLGTHSIDRTTWLAGAVPRTVTAALTSRFGAAVETDALLRLELDTGAAVGITVVSTAERTVDDLVVVCENGTISADPRRGTLVEGPDRPRMVHEAGETDIAEAFLAQLDDFVSSVVNGTAPRVPADHGRTVVATVLDAYRSAAAGTTVQCDVSSLSAPLPPG